MYFLKIFVQLCLFFINRSHIRVGHLLRRSIPQTNLSVTFQFCWFGARFPPLVDGLSSQLRNGRRQRDDLLDRFKKKRNLFLWRQCSDEENSALIIVGYNNLDTKHFKKSDIDVELHICLFKTRTRYSTNWIIELSMFLFSINFFCLPSIFAPHWLCCVFVCIHIFASGLNPKSLALDTATQKLYFLDFTQNSIFVINLRTSKSGTTNGEEEEEESLLSREDNRRKSESHGSRHRPNQWVRF